MHQVNQYGFDHPFQLGALRAGKGRQRIGDQGFARVEN